MAIRLALVALLVTVLVAVAAPWAAAGPAAERCDAACATVDREGVGAPCITDPACAGSAAAGAALAGLLVVLAALLAPAPIRVALGLVPASPPPAWRHVDARRLLRPPQPPLPS